MEVVCHPFVKVCFWGRDNERGELIDEFQGRIKGRTFHVGDSVQNASRPEDVRVFC